MKKKIENCRKKILFLTHKINILRNRIQAQQLSELDNRNKKLILNKEIIYFWVIFRNIRYKLNFSRKKLINPLYQSTDFGITIYR